MTTSKIQMDQIRSTSATVTDENIRAGSQKKSSLSPAEGLQGESPDATCPSGGGSLCHPCPAHPAVEQAGRDEREEFEAWMHTFDLPPQLDGETFADERYLEAACFGQFVYDDPLTQRCWAAWQARAALAQPSPAQVRSTWPKLEKPAQVGAVRFSAGVSSRLVVEAAQRLYEFESTPEKEAERIERLQAFREQCFEPLGTEFSKVLSDNLPELLSTAQAEQAEADLRRLAEAAEFGGGDHEDIEFSNQLDFHAACTPAAILALLDEIDRLKAENERLANDAAAKGDAARHQCAGMEMEIKELRGDADHWEAESRALQKQRDAALARVAELERQEPLKLSADVREFLQEGINSVMGGEYADIDYEFAGQLGKLLDPVYAAPVAQAQHSVPEEFIGRLSEFLAQRGATGKALLRELRDMLAAAPGKEVGHE